MDLEARRMAGVDEGLEIVEVRLPLLQADFPAEPGRDLRQRRSNGTLEEHVPAGRPHVHDDVRETHLGDTLTVRRNGIRIVGITGEVGRSIDPEEAGRLLHPSLTGCGQKNDSEPEPESCLHY